MDNNNNIMHSVNEFINRGKIQKKNKSWERSFKTYMDFYDDSPISINSKINNNYYKRSESIATKTDSISWIALAIIFGIAFFIFCLILVVVLSALKDRINKKKNDKVDIENKREIEMTATQNEANIYQNGFPQGQGYPNTLHPLPLRGFPPRGYARNSQRSFSSSYYNHSQVNIPKDEQTSDLPENNKSGNYY